MNGKVMVFTDTLNLIQHPLLKNFTKHALSRAPDYFFSIPASSSGKYHPDYSLGTGGLLRHTKALCYIAKDLHDSNMFELTELEYAEALVALHLHDILKKGDPEKPHTIFKHPILASRFVDMVNDDLPLEESLSDTVINEICEAIESHMGRWNKDTKDDTYTLPTPKTRLQRFVHTCDYIGSRRYLEVNFNKLK